MNSSTPFTGGLNSNIDYRRTSQMGNSVMHGGKDIGGGSMTGGISTLNHGVIRNNSAFMPRGGGD